MFEAGSETRSTRVIAVDWSGARVGADKKIWLAEARDGELLRLEGGRDRDDVVQHLIELQREGERLIVGLDFGFSFPEWFVRERGFASAPELWRWLAEDGCADRLLAECAPPFWGRKGTSKSVGSDLFRLTEQVTPRIGGAGAKSVFQIAGPGAVGTGSLRGMGALHRLREAGFAIWPFDAAVGCTVVEIYPRLFTGAVNKRNARCREEHMKQLSGITQRLRAAAVSTEDAFDASVSAMRMSEHAAELASLPCVTDSRLRIEGIIWHQGWRDAHHA